jgi:hypothetical protein
MKLRLALNPNPTNRKATEEIGDAGLSRRRKRRFTVGNMVRCSAHTSRLSFRKHRSTVCYHRVDLGDFLLESDDEVETAEAMGPAADTTTSVTQMSVADVAAFERDGFVYVRGGVGPEAVADMCSLVWEHASRMLHRPDVQNGTPTMPMQTLSHFAWHGAGLKYTHAHSHSRPLSHHLAGAQLCAYTTARGCLGRSMAYLALIWSMRGPRHAPGGGELGRAEEHA